MVKKHGLLKNCVAMTKLTTSDEKQIAAAVSRAWTLKRNLEFPERYPDIPPVCLRGLEDIPAFFPIEGPPYLAMRTHLATLPNAWAWALTAKELNMISLKAFLLFQTPDRLEKFKNRTHTREKLYQTAPQLVKNLKFPDFSDWHKIDFSAWGQAFIECGMVSVNDRFFNYAAQMKPQFNGSGFYSMIKTDFYFAVLKEHCRIPQDRLEALCALSVKFHKKPTEIKRILEYAAREPDTRPITPRYFLPPICIDGSEFGIEGTLFRKLPPDDPRILFLGDFTGCCERVTDTKNNLEATVASASYTKRNAFYVVERGKDILAHSWSWRGRQGEWVLDGFESKEANFQQQALNRLIEAILSRFENSDPPLYGINGIFIGTCADHLSKIDTPFGRYEPDDIQPSAMEKIGMTQQVLQMLLPPHNQPPYLDLKPRLS